MLDKKECKKQKTSKCKTYRAVYAPLLRLLPKTETHRFQSAPKGFEKFIPNCGPSKNNLN